MKYAACLASLKRISCLACFLALTPLSRARARLQKHLGAPAVFQFGLFLFHWGQSFFLLAQRFYHILGLYERVHAVCARKCLVQPQGYKRTLCDKSQLFTHQDCHFLLALLCSSLCCVLQVQSTFQFQLGESGWRKSFVKPRTPRPPNVVSTKFRAEIPAALLVLSLVT